MLSNKMILPSELNDHLTDPATRERLCMWSSRDCLPLRKSGTPETLNERRIARVKKRIKGEINEWDLQNQVFQKIYDSMVADFKQNFKCITSELKTIENNFTSEDIMQTVIDEMKADSDHELPLHDHDLTLGEKLVIGFTAPIWVPMGLVISMFAFPATGFMVLNQNRLKLKDMKENLEPNMKELTEETLDEMTALPVLKETLKDKVDELMIAYSNLLEDIPRIIEGDRKILNQLEQEFKDHAQQLGETYRPLYSDIDKQIAKMKCLYLCAIRAYDIDIKDLSKYEYLGEGQFGPVYQALWKPNKKCPPRLVAIKVPRHPVTANNALEILQEEKNLR